MKAGQPLSDEDSLAFVKGGPGFVALLVDQATLPKNLEGVIGAPSVQGGLGNAYLAGDAAQGPAEGAEMNELLYFFARVHIVFG